MSPKQQDNSRDRVGKKIYTVGWGHCLIRYILTLPWYKVGGHFICLPVARNLRLQTSTRGKKRQEKSNGIWNLKSLCWWSLWKRLKQSRKTLFPLRFSTNGSINCFRTSTKDCGLEAMKLQSSWCGSDKVFGFQWHLQICTITRTPGDRNLLQAGWCPTFQLTPKKISSISQVFTVIWPDCKSLLHFSLG